MEEPERCGRSPTSAPPISPRRDRGAPAPPAAAPTPAPRQFLAGGTTLLDLMKLDVMRPERADRHQRPRRRSVGAHRAGARRAAARRAGAHGGRGRRIRDVRARLSGDRRRSLDARRQPAAAQHGDARRQRAAAHALHLFPRHVSWAACNKRDPGSGCAALDGVNRKHAVLGTSEHCIATYPGDFAQALIALDADGRDRRPAAARARIPFEELHRQPGDTPHIETTLEPGELITGFAVPAGPWTRARSI